MVITCALTGGIHGKEANENLPEQPDEIVEQGIAAAEAGAAILHVHARNPDGSNTMSQEIYGELHERLCAETDAIVQLTTGGSPRLTLEERINTVRLAPEMCSLNMGLLNFFIRGEQVFFANHRDGHRALRARDARARRQARVGDLQRGDARGGRAPARARDPRAAVRAELRAPHADAGRRARDAAQPDGHGRPAGRPARRARGPAGRRSPRWAPPSCRSRRWRIAMGLNVRVGMEDNVLYRRGEPLREQRPAGRARRCGSPRELDRRPATPDEARELLGTRGRTCRTRRR